MNRGSKGPVAVGLAVSAGFASLSLLVSEEIARDAAAHLSEQALYLPPVEGVISIGSDTSTATEGSTYLHAPPGPNHEARRNAGRVSRSFPVSRWELRLYPAPGPENRLRSSRAPHAPQIGRSR